MQKLIKDIERLNAISFDIIGAAYKVHSELGPGLLESTYEVCLEYELLQKDIIVTRQKILPVVYQNIQLDAGYRIDLLVKNSVIVELKSVEMVLPIHRAQLMTYLKLSDIKLGLLLNFNVTNMKSGIHRVIM